VNPSSNTQPVLDHEQVSQKPAPDQFAAKRDTNLSHLNVEQRLDYLKRQFEPDDPVSRPGRLDLSRIAKAFDKSAWGRRAIKSAVALAVAAVVVWFPAQRLLQTTSVEAVVNARTLTLRAPIDGIISLAPVNLVVGTTFAAGTPLLRIANSRADRSRFDDLHRLQERTEAESSALKTRLESIQQMHAEFVEQTLLFRKGRIEQLKARIEESKSNLAAAATRQEETAAVLARALELDANGFQPKALLDKVRRDDEIARQELRSIEHRIKGVEVELESAKSGSFLGDSYNDRPRSSQRADELQQQIIELSSQLTEKQAMLSHLQKDAAIELDRLQLNSEAQVLAPSSSKIWELLTAPGEHVQRGQDLMRLLDCNAALVTAVVSEAAYNGLQIGAEATFRLRSSDVGMRGRVVNLTGVASAAANYAIAPSSLRKEQYRVAVEVPELAHSGQGCDLGRTGQVVFEHGGTASTAVAAP
jgi:multidrug resistance efflux pump